MLKLRTAALAVLLFIGTGSLISQPDREIYYDYFTDASYTVHCGYQYATCVGIMQGGCRTEFVLQSEGPACQNEFCWNDELGMWVACG